MNTLGLKATNVKAWAGASPASEGPGRLRETVLSPVGAKHLSICAFSVMTVLQLATVRNALIIEFDGRIWDAPTGLTPLDASHLGLRSQGSLQPRL